MLPLTPQQKKLVKARLTGKSDAQIGAELGFTPGTIRTYFTRIYARLNVNSWRECVGKIREIGEENL